MKIILGLSLVATFITFNFISYQVGYDKGFEFGSSNGYSKGQVDLTLEIANEINEKVNNSTNKESYHHFKDVHDLTLYIYKRNGVKTLALWDDSQDYQ
jgi:hypothetical protein